MIRKRHEKARTGCQTCKLRRVKCDEARPSCRRCISARRECRGYEPAPVGNYSWQKLLHWRQPCLSIDAVESRCLSYYHRVVAPSLAQSPDDRFWVIHVPQVLDQEPAARHAVLAISALHEDFVATLPKRASTRLDDRTGLTGRLEPDPEISSRSATALKHYNSAIRMVLEDRISNFDTLLTISLLFTCIELLQGSTEAAAKHCQHGVSVHKNWRLPSELSIAFHQLAFFLNTFGTSDTVLLPEPTYVQGESCLATADEMYTVVQACQALDAIMALGARLLRRAAHFQGGESVSYSAQDLKTEKFHVHRALSLWWEDFAVLRWRVLSTPPIREPDIAALRLLEARWLVANILESSCISNAETIFDEYLDQFRRIIELGEEEKTARGASGPPSPSFSFDMGYLPLLYIVGIKCRHLRLRVSALVLMKDLSCDRETIWDACFTYAIVKRVTEFEHGLSLDEDRMRSTTDPYLGGQLPCDAKRIVGFDITGDASLGVDSQGHAVVHRRICLFVSGSDGMVSPLWDCTTMRF